MFQVLIKIQSMSIAQSQLTVQILHLVVEILIQKEVLATAASIFPPSLLTIQAEPKLLPTSMEGMATWLAATLSLLILEIYGQTITIQNKQQSEAQPNQEAFIHQLTA